uniref:F-box domain-containing protein n=1 Tax=Oryza glumipatula TaxID=40148 RepID=A0A0E0BJW1_9ORYZ
MAAAVDRISDLPDDLIQRILHFAPAREAASTGVLSSRWRSTGAVNLAVLVRRRDDFFSLRDAFVRSAHAALAAAGGGHVRRLTIHVETERLPVQLTADAFLHRDAEDWEGRRHDVVAGVVSHPAARRVEELRVAAVRSADGPSSDGEVTEMEEGEFRLSLGTQPSTETLRVLDLTGCGGVSLPAGAALPRLTTLRLRLCVVQVEDLQGVVDSAPALATVHLESVFLAGTKEDGCYCARLRFPAATALVLAKCRGHGSHHNGDDDASDCEGAMEIDAPRLRSFKYAGLPRRFTLISPAAGMERADLHFLHDDGPHHYRDTTSVLRARFWRFLHNFRGVKSLKLKVTYLKEIAVAGNGNGILPPLHGVERLDVAALHDPASETSTVAIANLLRCCPNLRDLVLRLSTVPPDSTKNGGYCRDVLRRRWQADLGESVRRLARQRGWPKPPPSPPSTKISCMNQSLDNAGDIHGLSGRSFACLRSSLTRVGIQFRNDERSWLGVALIKFFAENAICLEEMRIDGGNERMRDHINHRVERWIVESGMRCFRVLPLERR